MAQRDYYETLGVPRDAGEADIKKAYRRLAREYHPDANKDDPDAAEKFKEINEAYEVLSDPEKRAGYDRFGQAGTPGGAYGPGQGGFGDFGFGGVNDIFDMFFGGGTGGQARRHGPQRGADLRYDLELDLEEAAFGKETELNVPRLEACQTCHGSGARPGTSPVTCKVCGGRGQVQTYQNTLLGRFATVRTCDRCGGEGQVIETPCLECHGTGRVRRTRKIQVKIPPGVDTGHRLRLSGEGEAGERGGPRGDLYVVVHVRPHPLFKREGDDIYAEAKIGFTQAALGAEVEVQTLDGPLKLKVPEGTQSGTEFRLRGKGVTRLRGHGRGDQYTRMLVETPTKLTERERELLRELASLRGEAVDEDRGFMKKVKDTLGM